MRERWIPLSFLISMSFGLWFRWMETGGPFPIHRMDFLRHAHSHLMFFTWIVPSVFLLGSPEKRWEGRLTLLTLLGYATGISFFLFGYGKVPGGDHFPPPSVILSSMHMILWIEWMVHHRREFSRVSGLMRTGWILLAVSTLGAWFLALRKPLGLDSPWSLEFGKEFFLGFFTEGFFLFSLLGLFRERIQKKPGWSGPDRVALFYLLLHLSMILAGVFAPEELRQRFRIPFLHVLLAGLGGQLIFSSLVDRRIPGGTRFFGLWAAPMILLLFMQSMDCRSESEWIPAGFFPWLLFGASLMPGAVILLSFLSKNQPGPESSPEFRFW